MPSVNGVGEPCAGEPHARFEAAGTGNGADLAKDTGVAQPTRKPAAMKAPGPKASELPRQSPTLRSGLAKCDLLIRKVPLTWEDGACLGSCPSRAEGTFPVNCDVRPLVVSGSAEGGR